MAEKKISELSELTALASNDKYVVVDTSASETKYVQQSTLDNYVNLQATARAFHFSLLGAN